METIHYTQGKLTLNDMEHHIILYKLIIIPVIGSISMELMNSVSPFAILFYCTATIGVLYTIIAPYYRKRKAYKKWVKEGCKKDDRYKWNDIV